MIAYSDMRDQGITLQGGQTQGSDLQMKQLLVVAVAVVTLVSCGGHAAGTGQATDRVREPIVGLPCEGCEAVFQGLPDSLEWSSRIAPRNEPGAAMRIEGTVRDKAGRTMSGIIVYAYHTNARGIYPTDDRLRGLAAHRHGRLRGWARTDENGRYRFDTIRPAGYPNTDLPAHVHMHVLELGRCTYYIDDIMFQDDPRLTETMRQRLTLGRGGRAVVAPVKDAARTWRVTRDIALGASVPGYPAPSR